MRHQTSALDCLCVKAGGPGWFLPSVAERAAIPPEVPFVYRDEARPGPGKRGRVTCRYVLSIGSADPLKERFIPSGVPSDPQPREVFSAGSVRVFQVASTDGCVTSFDTPMGNPEPPPP